MSTKDAIELAREMGLDLVEVSPHANPPVCKIIDYGRFNYDNQKNQKKAKKKQKIITLKEVQLSLNIAKHDYEVKLNHAKKFLENGDKVKFAIRLRGREMLFKDKALDLLQQCFENLGGEEVVKYDYQPKFEGNTASTIIIAVK